MKQWIPFYTRTASARVKRVLPLIPTLWPLLPEPIYLPANRPDAYTWNIAYESSQHLNPQCQSQQRIDIDNTELSCDHCEAQGLLLKCLHLVAPFRFEFTDFLKNPIYPCFDILNSRTVDLYCGLCG